MKSGHNSQFKNTQTTYQFILGPVKIKDGLFMGDQLAAKDIQFIISNKVTHVINTVSKIIPNMWERFGIQYISVNWSQKQQNIFDRKNNVVNEIFHFIQQAMQQGQSCLIHSISGKSRSSCVLIAYLIKKYNWNLTKCLEFIHSKKQHIQIKSNFLLQLHDLEKRMSQIYNLTTNWQEYKNQQDIILRNTFKNSKIMVYDKKNQKILFDTEKKKVQWGEKYIINNHGNNINNRNTPINHGNRYKQGKNQMINNNNNNNNNNQLQSQKSTLYLKSILKGQPYQHEQQQQQKKKNNTYSNNEILKNNLNNISEKKDSTTTSNNFINSIKSNFVHVTVNNFINNENDKKKKIDKINTITTYANSRPFSSDNKQRQKIIIDTKNKIFPYDNIMINNNNNNTNTNNNSSGLYNNNNNNTSKSPYDLKNISNNKTHSHNKINKKKDDIKVINYQRPQSANIIAQRRRIKNIAPNIAMNSKQQKQDMAVMGKKRYPSTNPREQGYKWK